MFKRILGQLGFWVGLALAAWPLLFAAWCAIRGENGALEAATLFLSSALGGWLIRSAYGNCRNIEIRTPEGFTGFKHVDGTGDVLVTFVRD